MCNTKFSIYLYSVHFGIRACAGGHVSLGLSVVGVFKRVFGIGFFLSSCYQRCFILFLFHSVMSQEEPISRGVGPEVQEESGLKFKRRLRKRFQVYLPF